MKKMKIVSLIFTCFILVVLLYSCATDDEGSMSIADRINAFVGDMNGNRSNAYKHCNPSASDYSAITNQTATWDTAFGAGTVQLNSVSNNNPMATTLAGTNNLSGETITFTMISSGDTWLINKIHVTNSGGNNYIFE
jgi:hypothetical protein